MPAARRCPGRDTNTNGHTTPCPTLIHPTARYCPRHQRQYEHRRGTRQQRGYDTTHTSTRTHYAHRMAQGETFTCPRCGQPIAAGQRWDLGDATPRQRAAHEPDATDPHIQRERLATPKKPEHSSCNRAHGGRISHQYRTE